MSAITYTANARAPLITDSPAHVAGASYSFDVKLRAYQTIIDQPKTQHVSLNGNTETVLMRATKVLQATFIWPPSLNPSMEEFLYSVAGGETFVFDPFGTVASADDPLNVVSVTGNSLQIGVMQPHLASPWRTVSLALRPVPA